MMIRKEIKKNEKTFQLIDVDAMNQTGVSGNIRMLTLGLGYPFQVKTIQIRNGGHHGETLYFRNLEDAETKFAELTE